MKKSYNNLNLNDKKKIIDFYYSNKSICFEEISDVLGVSCRSVSRVLQEAKINTRLKNRYTLNDNYFNIIDCQEKAYILGFIYADGFVGDEKHNNIVISINDRDLLEEIASLLNFTGSIRGTSKGGFENSKEGFSLNFSSSIMATRLREIGLYPNKSLTLIKFPKIRKDLERHFIRGYFDGDGSIYLSHNTTYHMITGEKKKYIYPTYCFSILGTFEFLKEIEYRANFKFSKIRDTRTREIKSLEICAKKEFGYIFKYLYNDSTIKLDRKYQKWNLIKSAFIEKSVKKIR